MIRQFGDYAATKAYGDYEQLPKGGYVMQIKGVELRTNSNGEYLFISADVFEGDYAGFFTREYKNQQREDKKWHCNYLLNIPKDDGSEQDGWAKRRFKTFTEALEDSNSGYHFDWDETKFKGKLIGGLFNEREYEKSNGEIGRAINWAGVVAADRIRSGDYKVPDDKLLKPAAANSTGFMQIPDNVDDDLPFK